MKTVKYLPLMITLIALMALTAPTSAQGRPDQPGDLLSRSRAEVVESTQRYQASLAALLSLGEDRVKEAAELHARRQQLFAEGIVSKRDLEESERALAVAQAKLEETRRQIAEAEHLMAETEAAEELAKSQPARIQTPRPVSYRATAAVIRYGGGAAWSLGNLDDVQAFFTAQFGRLLPTSAVGQTATHNRLGFDHRQAVDVAVHPDSAQGQALMGYLRSAGIPFIAFRAAVPGSATGAHIHIGRPSHRISVAT